MFRASVLFFFLGLLALLFGANSFAGVSIEIGKVLLVVFLVLSVISFVFGLVTDKRI